MLRGLLRSDSEKEYTFQTMLLENDTTKEVDIYESQEVDFCQIKEHLRKGGSVFITSKPSQKLNPQPINHKRTPRKRKAVKTVTAFYFDMCESSSKRNVHPQTPHKKNFYAHRGAPVGRT
jgi:hypothetical protein